MFSWLFKLFAIMGRVFNWFDYRFIYPVLKWCYNFFSRQIDKRMRKYDPINDWKENIYRDFKLWIDDLSIDIPPAMASSMDSCDLFTVLSEFTSLRQEIKFQNREQNKLNKHLQLFSDKFQNVIDILNQSHKDIGTLEERIRLTTEKKTILLVLPIRDALVRGYYATTDMLRKFNAYVYVSDELKGIVDGYEMAIRRFDQALVQIGINRVKTLNYPFDPKTMKAVGAQSIQDMEAGMVIEEYASGFVRGEEIIRYAEVVVSE
ncbi:MAG: nucleotide exchange factor GrpE [Desulfobacterales bacterium]|nr:nucleotide exchange factor GrpE [Desulfobacterales bacterium]